MTAAANIFLGQTEAPLMIKPFLDKMTNSELHCVMASGMATIAGSVLAAYISFNISASHLLSASLMSAPAALAASKLLFPGTYCKRQYAYRTGECYAQGLHKFRQCLILFQKPRKSKYQWIPLTSFQKAKKLTF